MDYQRFNDQMMRMSNSTRLTPLSVRLLLFVIIGVILILTFTSFNKSGIEKYQERTDSPLIYTGNSLLRNRPDLEGYQVKTHKGMVSLNELNEKVFLPFGFEIDKPTLPVPTLKMLQEPVCGEIFTQWLRISREPQPEIPPETIPADRTNEFLLNGYTAVDSYYFNDKTGAGGDKPRNWDKVSEFLTYSKAELGKLAYPGESLSVYYAMSKHRLDEMSGVVIGSMQPWVEVMALKNGAKRILTVEYNPLEIPDEFQDRLSSTLPMDFVTNWQQYVGKFDFAASFSSIEHSGLGRYGDPMDPIGDLREMLKIRCVLKKGGLLFLGVPTGTDSIQYNAHRIYGPIRLAMLMYGFEWIDTFNGQSEEPFDYTAELLHQKGMFAMTQHTIVLRKL